MGKQTGFTLTLKLLVLFLSVVLASNIATGALTFRISYNHLNSIATDLAHQIAVINEKQFTVLHFLTELKIIKDDDSTLLEKNRELAGIAAALGGCVLQHYSVPVRDSRRQIIGAVVMVINGNAVYDTIKDIDLGGGMTVDSELQASTQDASITQIISNIESVNGQILNQSDSVQETAGAVNQISSNISSLERMIEAQSDSVAHASPAVEETIGNLNSVNNSVRKMIAGGCTGFS